MINKNLPKNKKQPDNILSEQVTHKKELQINKIYSVMHLQKQFGLSETHAKLIAELAGFNTNSLDDK